MADREGPHSGKGPKGWTPSDFRLRDEVSERLMQDRLLDARGIEVAVDGGVVTLTGEVPGASDVNHAALLVRATPGVTEVRSDLRVVGGPRAVDRLHAPGEPDPDQPAHWSPSLFG
ncbi:MAG TPA: BON domain-containing protein [Phenylobacterium sp.]|nr:BON domain-containing protein [Phenylobacterium sp.]